MDVLAELLKPIFGIHDDAIQMLLKFLIWMSGIIVVCVIVVAWLFRGGW